MNSVLLSHGGFEAFAYRMPCVYKRHSYQLMDCAPICVIDITNPEWREKMGDLKEIQTLFIMDDLGEKDYLLLKEMKNLKILYIHSAEKLKDISFISDLMQLHRLSIQNSQVEDLTPIVELRSKQARGMCGAMLDYVALSKSRVKDVSLLVDKCIFREFILEKSLVPRNDKAYILLTSWNSNDTVVI